MYAIIESCGRQYKVTKGDVIFFEKLDAEEGKKVTFENVILVSDDGKVQIGDPYVKGVKVEGKVVAHGKGKKIIVFKYKPKKNSRKKQGHRQPYTKVEITDIKAGTTKKAETVEETEKKSETKTTAKKTTTTKTTTKKAEGTTTKKSTTTAAKKPAAKKTTTTAKKTTTTKKTTAKKAEEK